jgi:hypothetical protein
MEININNIPIGVAETHRELYMLKSALIYKEIRKMDKKHNFMIMPMSVYNIIECHQYFEPCHISPSDGIFKVGDFCGYECYVDMLLTEDRIIMSKDKQAMRENKINSILGISDLEKDLEIDIII